MEKSQKSLQFAHEAERFQLLVSSITDYAIYMLDPEGHVASWNSGAQRIKGYTADEIIGQHFSNFLTPEDRAREIPAQMLKTARETNRFEAEGWRMRKDGTRFWASVVIDAIKNPDGVLIGYAKITRDITERMMAQEALRESEERFRLLVQGVTDYAIYMISPEGIITNWNTGAERLKGYTQDEIIGSHFSRFYTREDQERGLPMKALATAVNEGRCEQEGVRVRKDGTQFYAHVVIDPIHNALGDLIGFAKITRDITERQRADEEVQRANAALFQAQKLEAIGKLTGGIAHDFNNLLSVISSGLEVLTMRLENSGEIKMLESMQRAVARGANLTQQLLSFARQQPLKAVKNNVNKLIESFESVLRSVGTALVDFDIKLAPDLNDALVDAARFEAALLNLVVNARDAMPEGGTITLMTENIALAANEVGNLAPGPYVRICIGDTGTGMSPDILKHAFEPFFTTKEIGKGTGLGLSQVYGFIIQSGGDIHLNSEIGKGTSVSLYLPALEHHEAEPLPVIPIKDKVLIVEDEPDVMLATVELFRSIGYDVLTASRGRDALEIIQRCRDIKVLFSDVMMPEGMSGIILARAAQQILPELKIILASGYPMPALKATHGSNLDDFNFISKPYRLSEIARLLKSPDNADVSI